MEFTETERMTFREVKSKSELSEILRSSCGHSIVIGTDAEPPRTCFLLELGNKAGAHVKIGMTMGWQCIKPSWILSPDEDTIAIGHDLTISFVDLAEPRLVSSQELESPFHKFLPQKGEDHLMALHELGADRFNFSSTRLWSFSSPDIVLSAYFRDDKTLAVQYWPGNTLLVDIATGRSETVPSGTVTREIEALINAYAAFNNRDLDGALATMKPDVIWPNGMDGGVVHGHEGVRAYWTRQWGMIDPHVDAVGFTEDESGRIAVSVHQVVSDLSGKVLVDRMVEHIYALKDGLIQSMDIRE